MFCLFMKMQSAEIGKKVRKNALKVRTKVRTKLMGERAIELPLKL